MRKYLKDIDLNNKLKSINAGDLRKKSLNELESKFTKVGIDYVTLQVIPVHANNNRETGSMVNLINSMFMELRETFEISKDGLILYERFKLSFYILHPL